MNIKFFRRQFDIISVQLNNIIKFPPEFITSPATGFLLKRFTFQVQISSCGVSLEYKHSTVGYSHSCGTIIVQVYIRLTFVDGVLLEPRTSQPARLSGWPRSSETHLFLPSPRLLPTSSHRLCACSTTSGFQMGVSDLNSSPQV